MDVCLLNRLCLVIHLDEVSLNHETFLWNELHWTAWPWGKEHCGKMKQTVYESSFAVNQQHPQKPHWTWFPVRSLYHSKLTIERDLVGFIGDDTTFYFLNFVVGIPCINLKPYGCQPFQSKISNEEYEGTNGYHISLVNDLEQWQQDTLAKLDRASLTNAMSKLTLDEHTQLKNKQCPLQLEP